MTIYQRFVQSAQNDGDGSEPIPPLSSILSTEGLQLPCKIFYDIHQPPCRSNDTLTQDVALAALYVSTKMHDTLKKPRELLAVSYAVRFPDLAAKSKHPGGEVDLDTMDPQV